MADEAVSRSDNGPSRKQTYCACLLAEEVKPTEKEIQQQATIDELRKQISEMNTNLSTLIDSQKQSSISGATSKANKATRPKTTVRLPTAGCWNCHSSDTWQGIVQLRNQKVNRKRCPKVSAKITCCQQN